MNLFLSFSKFDKYSFKRPSWKFKNQWVLKSFSVTQDSGKGEMDHGMDKSNPSQLKVTRP